MGTVSQFQDRTRPPAHRIESEEEAVSTARRLSSSFAAQASERDISRILPYAELDELCLSGLSAITVPPEQEGLDVANSLLGEIVAIIAEGDPSISEVLEHHFHALELIRTEASEELQSILFARALAGDRFATAAFSEAASLEPDGVAYRLSGRSTPSPALLYADWIIARNIRNTDGNMTGVYLSVETDGLQLVDDWDGFGQRTNGTGTLVASSLRVEPGAVLVHSREHQSTAQALAALLHAGTDLGIARAAADNLRDTPPSADMGKLAVGITGTAALIESAGHKLDFAQINASATSIGNAIFSADAASLTANAVALEAANALFELSAGNRANIGLNLDRHWRNARVRKLGQTTKDRYREAAAHYFGKQF
ncbi:monooxygenase [Rhizobium sp. S152]|uniref:monooxygenase n=1 Tax=Rhizobium sp. S152 TaxID=3055038 RepID=UPI0025A98961|nr:monooxygenase [Rhizobium sp. S152]MDM9627473.1 monooxygenase [Rhizobium sp. S152]